MAVLDSNILIYASRPGHEFLDPFLLDPQACVSALSIPEVLGYPNLQGPEETQIELWFSIIRVVDVTQEILRGAAVLRRKRRMSIGDAIIASTALAEDGVIITRNVDDFRNVENLNVVDPFAQV